MLRAKQQALIADVKPIMDALVAADFRADFRIAERLYHDVLRRADEEE